MKINYLLILTLIIFTGCSTQKLSTKGKVNSNNFYTKVLFTNHKGVIGLNVEINGEIKKFLFDTGADLSLVQQKKISGRRYNISGASGRKMKLGTDIVSSMKIDKIEFSDTYAFNGDLVGLKEQVSNFGGIIGQPIIRKANWLINYPKKELELSNRNLADDEFKEIQIIRENGYNPYTYLEMNNKKYKVVIDLGSSSTINLPTDSEFAKDLLKTKTIEFTNNTRERYSLGGLQKINEKVGNIPKIKLGEFELENVEVNINQSSQPRIGINFFKDFQIYIDNTNKTYKLKKNINTVANTVYK